MTNLSQAIVFESNSLKDADSKVKTKVKQMLKECNFEVVQKSKSRWELRFIDL